MSRRLDPEFSVAIGSASYWVVAGRYFLKGRIGARFPAAGLLHLVAHFSNEISAHNNSGSGGTLPEYSTAANCLI
jgi:hypothetical protein